MIKKFLPVLILAASSTVLNAADIYVSSLGMADGNGSKESPYNTLSEAIDNAVSEDVIHITEGKFIPKLLDAPRKSTFSIKEKTLSIIGGYNTDFSSITGLTILSADINGDDVYDEITGILTSGYEDNCSRVITVGKNANVVLENLILQGGYADLTADKLDTGGAMYIGSPVKMENCVITGNYCKNSAGGGGICAKGDLKMNNCKFIGNHGSGDGGALYIKGAANEFSITNCYFLYNKSTSGSASFISEAKTCYFYGNCFESNTSQTYGTLTFYNKNFSNTATVVNNTFVNNTITGHTGGKELVGGAGVYAYLNAAGTLNLVNNTIIGSTIEAYTTPEKTTPTNKLGGAVFARQGKLILANNIIAGNISLSGKGDLYASDGNVTSKNYNFYTSEDNMSITPSSYDIIGDYEFNKGIEMLPTVFDCKYEDGKIIANAVDNGGNTKTVKVVGENIDFDGLTVKSVPASNISEEDLNIDLNNDGEIAGFLNYDQRGAKRNTAGHAFIGAYEDDGKMSDVDQVIVETMATPYVNNGHIVLPFDAPAFYSVYAITGQTVLSGQANGYVDLASLVPGVYVAHIIYNGYSFSLKVAL